MDCSTTRSMNHSSNRMSCSMNENAIFFVKKCSTNGAWFFIVSEIEIPLEKVIVLARTNRDREDTYRNSIFMS